MRSRVGFGKPPVPCDPKRAILVPTVQDGSVPVAVAASMPNTLDLPVGSMPGLTRKMRLLQRFEAVETHQRSKGALHRVHAFETLDDAKAWLETGHTPKERQSLVDLIRQEGGMAIDERPPEPYGNGWVRWVRANPVYADAMLMDAVEEAAERIAERAA